MRGKLGQRIKNLHGNGLFLFKILVAGFGAFKGLIHLRLDHLGGIQILQLGPGLAVDQGVAGFLQVVINAEKRGVFRKQRQESPG